MIMENEEVKYESGITGKAEVRFGGKILINVCEFKDSDVKCIALHELYHKHTTGDTCSDNVHPWQVILLFNNIKSIDMMQEALDTIRETMKRDKEEKYLDDVDPKHLVHQHIPDETTN